MAGRKAGGASGVSPSSAAIASSSKPLRHPDRTSRTHRGLTCANCRSRKTRCDGTQPTCKTCEVYRDVCRYEKPPPMSQIVAMARRLQEAEKTIAELRQALEEKGVGEQVSSGECRGDTDVSATVMPKQEPDGVRMSAVTVPVLVAGMSGTSASSASPDSQPHSQSQTSPRDRSSQDMLFDLSLDSNGKLSYIGPTSAVHNPPFIESHTSPIEAYDEASVSANAGVGGAGQGPLALATTPTAVPPTTTKSDVRALLTAKAIESRAWEDFAMGNAAAQTEIPRAVVAKLLQIHWIWIAPLFMWVYRPAFMRDMATGGTYYYSPLLLTILCGHAARFQDDQPAGDALIARARLLLGSSELHKPSSIPTVQALLQLSARDMAYGQISQAWLYSGMAFRMVSDLGLQHSVRRQSVDTGSGGGGHGDGNGAGSSDSGRLLRLGNLNAEDLEIRRRLYWSCYLWDKAISLYLGRMPALIDLPFDSSPELLDDSAEHELWTPYYGAAQNLSRVAAGAYPPMKSHAISCFENNCRLAVIICDIILQLYSYSRRGGRQGGGTSSPPDAGVDGAVIHGIRERLDAWRANTPPHLLCDPDNLPPVCCPPHILTQNLLYYTTIILLHRPFYSAPAHHAACRQAADQLERLLLHLERTFGFNRITYLMAYCAYTGASVMVQDVKLGDDEAGRKIQTFCRALRLGVKSCPLAQRSLDIINESLRQPAPEPQPHRHHHHHHQHSHYPPSADLRGDRNDHNATNNNNNGMASATSPTTTETPITTNNNNPLQPLPPDPLLRNYLPAFPYYHPTASQPIDLDGMGPGSTLGGGGVQGDDYNFAAMDLDAFSLLDGFPENHLDLATAAAWYIPQ